MDLNQGPNDQNLVLQVRKISSSFNRLWFSSSKILATKNYRKVNVRSSVFQVRNILNDRKKLRTVIDPELNRSSYTMESIAMFANLASRCVRVESSERPPMADCVKELQGIIYINSKGSRTAMHTLRMV